jgi:hypothetical protein
VNWNEFFFDGIPGLMKPGLLMKLSIALADSEKRL